MGERDRGQATVEFALLLPLVVVVVLVVLQILSVARDAVALTAAARAGARAAMVEADVGAIRAAAAGETRLAPGRLTLAVRGAAPGGLVVVTATYRAPTDVPLVGAFVGDVTLTERFTVLRE